MGNPEREGGRERRGREDGRVGGIDGERDVNVLQIAIVVCINFYTLICIHLHVILNKTGDCDWSTPCMSGVCFANSTGCPVMGAYALNYNQSTTDETTYPGNDYSEDKRHHHYITTIFASVVAGVIVAIFLGCIATRHR